MKTKNEFYQGYKIIFNLRYKRFEAKKDRRVRFHNTILTDLKSSVDSWLKNIECSARIAATPYKAGSPNAGLY